MRTFLFAFGILAALPVAAPADLLVFMNGDRIPGKLAGGDDAGHLLWKTAEGEQAVRFPISAIHRVELDDPGAAEPPGQNVSLSLTNGDSLHGRLIALTDSNLSLESPNYGRLEVPRAMIGDLNVTEGGYYLLAGAGSSKEWFVDKRGSWRVLDGVLRASDYGVLGRDLPKSSRIRMDFDVSTEDSGVGFTVHLFATNKQVPARDSNYTVQFSGSYVYARKAVRVEEAAGPFGRGGGINQETLGEPRRLERAPGNTPIHVTLLADARAGIIILMVDGKQVHRWDDPRGFGEKYGSAIGFASNSRNIEIRNLSVARWNGATDSGPAADSTNLETDIVHTGNDDQITGLVTGVKDGALAIESEHFGSIALPTDRIQRVRLATLDREQARRMAGDVQATFQRGGRLTLKMTSLDSQHLTGFSENTGEASLALSGLREILFNLYEEKYPDPDSANTRDPAKLLEANW